MSRSRSRNFVFAVEFAISTPDRVWPVLQRHQESLVDLGARYVYAYESVVEPGKVLVIIGISTEQPLLNLLRSPYFFEWFDAVGVEDLPAVFAGETVERMDIGEAPEPGSEIVVAAVTPLDDIDDFVAQVRDSREEFAKAGIRRTVVYRAFDSSHEVMFVQQLDSAETALRWIARSPTASEWLAAAGIGVFPPVFVGRFVNAMRMSQPTGIGPL
ncbi:fatty-acid--CoA ligase [Mycobacterium sp. SMC-4]|uniref:fatty-acid--CoA ligase n=1 Tax=Mycobacterium sp. SMC-4 TaxID=2857059 RepID=UPI0021B40091|nr:fatty-acid--CoA ligase [Mycobacterium sp. SMC-4]UXA20059.1 fatty-acid--CoA ligase [Mycobacterium sp. SMC-4]